MALYSTDPTANADVQAQIMRAWYERNREGWMVRWGLASNGSATEDEFMLRMLGYARLVLNCEIPLPDDGE